MVFNTELPVYSPSQDYCGTIDLVADITLEGKEYRGIIDFKCGQPEPEYAYQLAAYALAFMVGITCT